MTDVQRRTRPLRICRAVFTAVLFYDLVACALDLAAENQVTATLMAFAATLVAATVAIQTFTIRRMRAQAIRELTRRAEQLEFAAQAAREHPEWKPAIAGEWQRLKTGAGTMADFEAGMARLAATLGPCSHPDAEPVDLTTGERVAWVCPDPECNADLPADWKPSQVTGALTPAASTCDCPPGACAPVGARVYNAGSPVARYCRACGKRIAPLPDERVPESKALSAKATWDDVAYASEASEHFAQLARVGQEYCLSYCPICAPRLAARVVARRGPGVIAGDDYFTPADMALMRSGATFGSDATVTLPSGKKMTGAEIQRWIENDQAQQWIDKGRRGSGE